MWSLHSGTPLLCHLLVQCSSPQTWRAHASHEATLRAGSPLGRAPHSGPFAVPHHCHLRWQVAGLPHDWLDKEGPCLALSPGVTRTKWSSSRSSPEQSGGSCLRPATLFLADSPALPCDAGGGCVRCRVPATLPPEEVCVSEQARGMLRARAAGPSRAVGTRARGPTWGFAGESVFEEHGDCLRLASLVGLRAPGGQGSPCSAPSTSRLLATSQCHQDTQSTQPEGQRHRHMHER